MARSIEMHVLIVGRLRVHVQVDGYGTAHGFDYLDYYYNERFGVPGTAYFHRLLNTFYSIGYIEGMFKTV